MFPHTIEFAETHRLATQVEERLSLDLEMPSDVPVAWSPLRPSLPRARPSVSLPSNSTNRRLAPCHSVSLFPRSLSF